MGSLRPAHKLMEPRIQIAPQVTIPDMPVVHIIEPTLLLDKDRCLRNIETMSAKARMHHVKFRPHFKTHQSREIGGWFRPFGIHAITVSSLKMASYFAGAGWNDITVAFPANVLEIGRICALAEKIQLNLLVVSAETVTCLGKKVNENIGLFIKIDTGYHRTGIPSSQTRDIDSVISEISKYPHLQFKGFLAHAGHSYNTKSRSEIQSVHEDTLKKMSGLKDRYRASFPRLEVTVGDTPTCSVADHFEGIDEIRPGNFVFYDAMQYLLGCCTVDQIAVAMACPVVAVHKERGQLVIYGGAVHFSKDNVMDGQGKPLFGLVVELREQGWSSPIPGAVISSLSQEHGVITAGRDFIDRMRVGSVVAVLPVHSCLTADCMKGYSTTDNKSIDHMSRTW